MARVTVEDCTEVIPNCFDLVVVAAQRARQLFSGAPVKIDGIVDDKYTVVALREIAERAVDIDSLKESAIQGYQANVVMDDIEQEMADMLSHAQEASDHPVENYFSDAKDPNKNSFNTEESIDSDNESNEISFEDLKEAESEESIFESSTTL